MSEEQVCEMIRDLLEEHSTYGAHFSDHTPLSLIRRVIRARRAK